MSTSSSIPPSSLLGASEPLGAVPSIDSSISSKTTKNSRSPTNSRAMRASITRSDTSSILSDPETASPARKKTKTANSSALAPAPRKAKRISYGGVSKKDWKCYLEKGLYAKEDESLSQLRFEGDSEGKSRRASALVANYKLSSGPSPTKSKVEKEQQEIGPILPLPLFEDGTELLKEERDFQLPFDVMRDFVHHRPVETPEEKLEREMSRKPPKYTWLPKNIIVKRKPDVSETEAVCNCVKPKNKEEKGCLDNCMNRLMFYTCSPETCPCGKQCSNLPMYMLKGIKQELADLVPIWTGSRGFGLKTMIDIKAGDFVVEYRGEIITREECYKRVSKTKDHSFYFLDYDGSEVLDAALKGNAARFINHSCGPNLCCVSWKYSELEEYQVGIFAKEDIAAGTELTYDYGWQNFSMNDIPGFPLASSSSSSTDEAPRQQCFCGADACSGYLGAKKRKIVSKPSKKSPRKAKRSESKRSTPPVGVKGKGKGKQSARWNADQASSDEEESSEEESDDDEDLVPFNPPPSYDGKSTAADEVTAPEKVVVAVRKPPTARG